MKLNSQAVLFIVGVMAIFGLSLMPKIIVTNEPVATEALVASSPENNTAQSSTTPEVLHQTEISEEKAALINALRQEFYTANTEKAKIAAYQSLADAFKSLNSYDSAALYGEQLAKAYPTTNALILAADAAYEAFTFASFNEEKSARFAELTRRLYDEYLNLQPNDFDAQTKMGMTYISSDNPMQGILMIRQVLEKEPDNKLALFNMGVLSMQSGQWDRAVSRFEHLVALDTTDTQNRFYLGVCYKEKGQKQKALKELLFVREKESNIEILSTVDSYLKDLQ